MALLASFTNSYEALISGWATCFFFWGGELVKLVMIRGSLGHLLFTEAHLKLVDDLFLYNGDLVRLVD